MNARKYKVTLTGVSPLLMHRDNIDGCELVREWQKDPANKKASVAGDDRTPAWIWTQYCYHDGEQLIIDSGNLMAMFKDGGKKCPALTGRGSLKAATQSGIVVDDLGWPLMVSGAPVPWAPLEAMMKCYDFPKHVLTARKLGFELFVKRARVGSAKHIRVRPRFSNWSCSGTITVIDDQLKTSVLANLLTHAGFYCGLCDWRPGSPVSSGQYGRFEAAIEEISR